MLTVGLMSGTSLDGIDAALIDTDGKQITKHFGGITFYPTNTIFEIDFEQD